ncbi:MAG: phosphoglycerate kinase [Minisyncoccales bacterium]
MLKTLKNLNLKQKRVLVRCDFNVPLSAKGEILDDFRIQAVLPTIEYLIKQQAKIILMSHLGRPDGQVVENLRLTPIQDRLMEYLDLSIVKAPDCIGGEIEEWTKKMEPGEILLLENLRFHREEEAGDLNFARQLAQLGDVYINDAFAVSHRPHASVVGVARFLPTAAGLLLEKEINILTKLKQKPNKPLVVIIGGAKAETKATLINQMSVKAEAVLVGGLINKEIKEKHIKIKYPERIIAPVDEVAGKDIGPATINLFEEKINSAKTIFWNGPLGWIEKEEFRQGTEEIAKAIIKSGAFSVVGGGETVEFISQIGLLKKFNHVSTGGGAMLEFLAGEKLPGIEILYGNKKS